MYSYEKRKKAVDLFKQYDESFSAVKRELGYPNSKALLRSWVREIEQYGDLHMVIIPAPFEPPVRSLRATLPAHQSHTFR